MSAVSTQRMAAAELSDAQVIETIRAQHPRDQAIESALAFLRTQQQADGRCTVSPQHATALTSLALMAHFAAGHPPDDRLHREWLHRSLSFVLTSQDANGYFGAQDGSRMYGHGITTLMLAEALGMTVDPALDERLRSALEKAIAVTVQAARVAKQGVHSGGWRYRPDENRSDLSLSGWQLMSLHAAQQVGMTVPEDVIVNAVTYAKRLTSPDGAVGYDQPGQNRIGLRGLALWAFANAPESATVSPTVIATISARMEREPITWGGQFFFYRAYYDAVGLSRAAPEVWDRYAPNLQSIIISHQASNGSWPAPPGSGEDKHGLIYTTSMSVLALAVQRHLLPVYQR